MSSTRAHYQIALRHDDMGLDDVVVKDVEMFRMERMDNGYVWLACYLTDGQEIVFDMQSDSDGYITYSAREPLPDVVYERGSGTTSDGAQAVAPDSVPGGGLPGEETSE